MKECIMCGEYFVGPGDFCTKICEYYYSYNKQLFDEVESDE